MTPWQEAQQHEKNFWGNCRNTFHEEEKQKVYAGKMGIKVYNDFVIDAENKKILDIGCGPVSMLLKCINLGLGVAIDPCDYPSWVLSRYEAAGIQFGNDKGEEIPNDFEHKFDECWIYNVLQHTDDPEKVIKNALRVATKVKVFEWIDVPTDNMHLHTLTENKLNEWLGVKGRVEQLNEKGCVGKAYYV